MPSRRPTCAIRVWPILLPLLFRHAAGTGAAILEEDFSSDPATRGWQAFGEASLFHWDPVAQALEVTWDSSRTNSFFCLPLGTVLSQSDDFSFSFDLRLRDIRVGSTPGKSNEFEIAVGLLNRADASRTNAFRGAGQNATYGVRNLVEFDYFPDAGFGDTWATTVVSTNNRIFPVHNFPLTLSTGDTFRITFNYTASNRTVQTAATRNGAPFGLPPDHTLLDLPLAGTPDFRVDAFAMISYSDAIQTGPSTFHGSVLAHGTVDNVLLALSPPPVRDLRIQAAAPSWKVVFQTTPGWSYTLERSGDLRIWSATAWAVAGPEPELTLVDTNRAGLNLYYRVKAERP